MRKLLLVISPLFIFILASANAALSVVALDTGDQLIGEILPESSPVTLMLRSPLLGEIKVPRARVISIKAKAPEAAGRRDDNCGPRQAQEFRRFREQKGINN